MKENRARQLFIIHCVVPLLLGAAIYLLFREDAHVSALVRRYIALPRLSTAGLPDWIDHFLRFYFTDIAWAYALTFTIGAILWGGEKQLLLTFLICVCFETLIELFQLIGVIQGTFDWKDIALEVIATIVAIIILYRKGEINHEKKRKNP